MSFKELKREFDAKCGPDGEALAGSGEDAVSAEEHFRYWLLRLLFEINGNLDSLAADYKKLVKIQEERLK